VIVAEDASCPGHLGLGAVRGGDSTLRVSYERLADLAVAAGDPAAARTLYDQPPAIRRRLAEVDPGNVQLQRDLNVSLGRLGRSLVAKNKPEAIRLFAQAEGIIGHLFEIDPSNTRYHSDHAYYHARLAKLRGEPNPDTS
jgi:hypothetical protein